MGHRDEPARDGRRVKGRVTIRTAAVFFALSAVVQVLSVRWPVPLGGALRGGVPGAAYHLTLAALFAIVAVGLWTAARWGARAVYVATALVTLDNLRYLLDRAGRSAELASQLQPYPDILEAFGEEILLLVSAALTLFFTAGWWGFALYIYLRRHYFSAHSTSGLL